MAEEKATYLDHLERWLNYEDELDSPPLAEGVNAQTVAEPVVRERVDSFVESERSRVALDVAKENMLKRAAKSKQVADLGKISRLDVRFPLPSCAKDEDDEDWADDRALRETKAARFHSVVGKIKNVLGL
ncbi:hypothetical protein EKO04_003355 [Ascochyta lentis]|uniref:Uncharacterized protein n=1 Tax=Ascochyta lentis TaxID=205686 RepID=A0A8H7J808_9PLEO|nr:hypothetical protein EKO04_003355 [Ascochyta lentis]